MRACVLSIEDDPDVTDVWWPDLKDGLEKDFAGIE
jgi:hypothetical protein